LSILHKILNHSAATGRASSKI